MFSHDVHHTCPPKLENNKRESKIRDMCFDWVESIVQAVIIVVVLMNFVFRTVNISGESMLDTLHDNDKVVLMLWNYTPKNGDVVVIKRGKELDSPLIKRVIAVGGQKLSIDFKTGSVIVDGEKLNETYIKERMWLQGDVEVPAVIPDGYCFVMGDNRNNSTDSRFSEVDLIPYHNIVGKATHIIFPFDRIGVIP